MKCHGCDNPPDGDGRRWQDTTLGFSYCINCVDKKKAPDMKYLYQGFDGNEFDPTDPAFHVKIGEMTLNEVFDTLKKIFGNRRRNK